MPKREDDIRDEIIRLDDYVFERFVTELISREIYSGLIPTSQSFDLGEDARTETSTLFLHEGNRVSLAVSKESGWGKIEKDCNRCKETNRAIDIFVFVTAGKPRRGTIDRWISDVERKYGWTLEVYTIEFLAPRASRPENEDLVEEYLAIPPLNGDYISDIEEKINRITSHYRKQIQILIPGLPEPIKRIEIDEIEKRLAERKNIVVTGDAGAGKSGIALILSQNGATKEKTSILLDARQFGSFQTNTDLRNFFDLKGPPHLAIHRLARKKNCLIIFDQLDNIAGLSSAKLTLDFIDDLCSHSDGLEIVAICRNKEKNEESILRRLTSLGFEEIVCRPISHDNVKLSFSLMGIKNYPTEMVNFCTNLLNLELVGQIHVQNDEFNYSMLLDEVQLWEQFIDTWLLREGSALGDSMISDAINMSKLGLQHPEGIFEVDFPQSLSTKRLISWNIISQRDGRMFRFRHEKFQDFLYAKDAADRWLMPKDILVEILEHKSRNIFRWIDQIYKYKNSEQRIKFLKESFNV